MSAELGHNQHLHSHHPKNIRKPIILITFVRMVRFPETPQINTNVTNSVDWKLLLIFGS